MKWQIKTRKNKFNSSEAHRDGMRFHSQAEARYYDELQLLKKAGDVSFFLRQCPMHLAGGTKYVVDFMVFYADGNVDFVDVKGFETPAFIKSKKQVENLYPIEINVVKMNRK